ncbi:MAG: UDP-N-acetylmuramoyl-tripeptide--D-alanyl-D-alanine ligase, partial [Anaerolineales bacterium]
MLTLAHVIEALTGYAMAGGALVITDTVIDSRLAGPGSLFVALPGENVDGHDYVAEAISRGATVALVQRDLAGEFDVLDLRDTLTFDRASGLQAPICLRVEDSLAGLQAIARYWRARLNVRVVGITGSVGKTTTKEIIAAVLGRRYRTLKSIGNLNNEIGLPISLLRLSEAHERAVLEMGFYTPGEIEFLCEMAQPVVGVITNVYPVHAERAGTLENIVQGKSE